MTEFTRLLGFLQPYRAIFVLSVVLMIATGLLEGATGLLLVPIFNQLSGTPASGALSGWLDLKAWLPSGSLENWRVIAGLLIGFTLAKGVAEYLSSFSMSYIGQSVIADVRAALYNHFMRQPATFFAKHPTNELASLSRCAVNSFVGCLAKNVAGCRMKWL